MQHIDLILYPIFNFLRAQSAQIQYLCKCKGGRTAFFLFFIFRIGSNKTAKSPFSIPVKLGVPVSGGAEVAELVARLVLEEWLCPLTMGPAPSANSHGMQG